MHYLIVGLSAIFLATVTVNAPVNAQEPQTAEQQIDSESKSSSQADGESLGESLNATSEMPYGGLVANLIPENLQDAGFKRYATLDDVQGALQSLNAVWMADLAMALAEGERVLMRSHRSGLTSKNMMDLAGKIAIETGDADSLGRLVKAAAAAGHAELAEKLELASQTAGSARDGGVDMEKYEYLLHSARVAKVAGNKDLLEWVANAGPDGLSTDQKALLGDVIAGARATLESESENETSKILDQLSFGARPTEALFNKGRIYSMEYERPPEGCNMGWPVISGFRLGFPNRVTGNTYRFPLGDVNALPLLEF